MKKKFLILFLAALTALCIGIFASCGFLGELIGGENGVEETETDGKGEDADTSGLKAPESVRLDMRYQYLYVQDCSTSGVGHYEVTQEIGNTKTSLASKNAADLEKADGYLGIRLSGLNVSTPFTLTVLCKKTASDKQGVSKSFTFEDGGSLVVDETHCSFNPDTGLFTWTAVEDAARYMVEGWNTVTVVDTPQFTVGARDVSIKVTPLFDTYKVGTSVEIFLEGVKPALVYNTATSTFTWDACADSYRMEITENGETHTWNLTEEELYYVPTAECITVRLLTLYPLRRPGVVERTYDVLPAVTGVTLGVDTCVLSWDAVPAASGYEIILQYDSGSTAEIKETALPKYALNKGRSGHVTAKIRAITATQNLVIAPYATFTFDMISAQSAILPHLAYDASLGTLSVSVPAGSEYIAGYVITLTAEGAETQTAEVECDDTPLPVQLHMPAYQVSQVEIARKYRSEEGHYCFTNNTVKTANYVNQVLYAGAPEVVMKSKSVDQPSGRAFVVEVKFPEAMSGKGTFTVGYTYAGATGAASLYANREITLPAPSDLAHLEIAYTKFEIHGTAIDLFSDKFQTDVTKVSGVSLSADAQKITWERVPGADGYRVERSVGGAYETVYSGTDTQYAHGVTAVGEYAFRVFAVSNASFTVDSLPDECRVTKLQTPTVLLSRSGEIVVTAESGATVVTLLNGVETAVTEDALRAVLTSAATTSLTARCTRESTPKTVYIRSDDTAPYTLHRMADLDAVGLTLSVDAAANKVSWGSIAGASDYACLLYRRESAADEYVFWCDYSGTETEIDGSTLPYGQYELALKPMARQDGNDFYLYLGDYATDTFQKDGVRAVGLLAGGAGFAIDSLIASANTYTPQWSLYMAHTPSTKYAFELGDSVLLSQNASFETLLSSGSLSLNTPYTLTFAVDYGSADALLSGNKTLKADAYEMAFTIKRNAIGSFTGKYAYVERQYNSEPVQINVTLTPSANSTLNAVESYMVFYKVETGSVSQMPGAKVTVTVPGARQAQYFYLGIQADKFIDEDGAVVFYRSTLAPSSTADWYRVTLQETPHPNATNATHDAAQKQISFHLSFISPSYSITTESFVLEYLAEDGTWIQALNLNMNNYAAFTVKVPYTTMPRISSNQVSMRLRWSAKVINGILYEASDWGFLTVTL